MTASADRPVVVVGAGPIGLTTALGLAHYGVPVVVLENDAELSQDTKAGTILTRTLEVFDRYGVLNDVLRASLRIDTVADLDRTTGATIREIETRLLQDDTRFPFLINVPQHHLEPVLARALETLAPGALRMAHEVVGFTQHADHVTVEVATPDGPRTLEGAYLLGCDGGRSAVRRELGVTVEGFTLPERYVLVDVKVDLDVRHPRDLPYLAYFADPEEWMILVRQPQFWRFLWPRKPDRPALEPGELLAKVRSYVGDVDELEVVGTYEYAVHQRSASSWQDGRVFLLGDAAHLLTPMWALGLNTGVLDASNLPWRLAWVLRGWAEPELLEGYEREQKPLALHGSGEMAEAARRFMARQQESLEAMSDQAWANAMTRSMLAVRLDVDGSGSWALASAPTPGALRTGDRVPDLPVWNDGGATSLHQQTRDAFVALYLTDARRRPTLPADTPALKHRVVSRWDAPLDGDLRAQALFDPGGRVAVRLGLPPDTVVLLRPDSHVAAIVPMADGADAAERRYAALTGRPSTASEGALHAR